MENPISTNFDRNVYIFDRFAKKQVPYQKRSNVCADWLKIEHTKLPAGKKQSNEIHRNLPIDYNVLLLLGYNSFTVVSFIHSIHSFLYSFFNQSFIHSKINC